MYRNASIATVLGDECDATRMAGRQLLRFSSMLTLTCRSIVYVIVSSASMYKLFNKTAYGVNQACPSVLVILVITFLTYLLTYEGI